MPSDAQETLLVIRFWRDLHSSFERKLRGRDIGLDLERNDRDKRQKEIVGRELYTEIFGLNFGELAA